MPTSRTTPPNPNGSPPGIHRWLECPLRLFLVFYAVWWVAHAPAFFGAWWYADDFLKHEYSPMALLRGATAMGRPGFGVLLLLFQFERPPDATVMNILMRAAQGAIHVGAAVLLVRLLREYLSPVAAGCAALPFLLWGLSGEATLWRAAIMYPTAALLSLGGMWIIIQGSGERKYGWMALGVALCTAAALTNQSAVTAGVMVFLLVLALRALQGQWEFGRASKESIFGASGFLLGAILSVLLVRHFGDPRGAFVEDWLGKWHFLVQLNRYFLFFEGIYSPVIRGIHFLLLLLVPVLWIVAVWQRRFPMVGMVAVPLALLAGCLIPYAPNLIVADNHPSLRIMYTAPLLLTTLLALGWVLGQQIRSIRPILAALALVLGMANMVLAWENAREYRILYERDVETAHAIEAFAVEHGTWRVLVVDLYRSLDPHVNVNPYDLRIRHAQNRYSAFLFSWVAPSFLRQHTNLWHVEDAMVVKYLDFPQQLPRHPSLQWHYIPEDDLVLVAPR